MAHCIKTIYKNRQQVRFGSLTVFDNPWAINCHLMPFSARRPLSLLTCKHAVFLLFLGDIKSISFYSLQLTFPLSRTYFLELWVISQYSGSSLRYYLLCLFCPALKESAYTIFCLALIILFASEHLLLHSCVISLFVFLHEQEYKLHESKDLVCLDFYYVSTLPWVIDS